MKYIPVLALLLISSQLLAGNLPINYIFSNGFENVPLRNDTGMEIQWAPQSVTTVPCSNSSDPQKDCDLGRDKHSSFNAQQQDGHAGFSFTKLDSSGSALPFSSTPLNDTSWQCNTDNVTGLTWERKFVANSSIHGLGILGVETYSYRWGGESHQGSGLGTYYSDWNEIIDSSNNNNYCGFSDWRLPSKQELMDILDYMGPFIWGGAHGATYIDPEVQYFDHRDNIPTFWTSTPSAQDESKAWAINFKSGRPEQLDRTTLLRVVLVRGGS